MRNPANDDPACVPYNVMGIGVNSRCRHRLHHAGAGSKYGLRRNQHNRGRTFGAVNFVRSIFELPAGEVSAAFGGEHRKMKRCADNPIRARWSTTGSSRTSNT